MTLRIVADAAKQGQFLSAAGTGSRAGLLNLVDIGHAGGDNHGLSGGGDVFDQRQVNF